MQTFVGMILGMLLLVCGVYVYDSMQTSTATNGQAAQVQPQPSSTGMFAGGRLEGR